MAFAVWMIAVSAPNMWAQYGFYTMNTAQTWSPSSWGNPYAGYTAQTPWVGYGYGTPQTAYGYQQPWQLGAYLENTPSGVLIQQVVPGGLADRSGLRAGDVIVSVAGTQVGLVNGRVIDAVYEMSGRANSSGRVSIMVLKASTRLLTPMTINVQATTEARAIVTGRVFLGNSATYGGGSVKVELTNISKPYLTVSGGNTYLPVVGSGPFPFTISFNAKYANAGDQYRLTATYYNVYRQIVAFANLDIPAPVPGTMVSYDLNLEQSAISNPVVSVPVGSIAVGSIPVSNIPVSNSYAGYYTPQQNIVDDAFRQLLGRNPSASEAQAWYQQMASGALSVNELKAELLASPAFYDRAGDNPDVFVQQMIEMTTRLPAGRDELQYWRSRLAALGGNRLELCREYMTQFR
jgi:hypothetical protein